MLGFCKFYVYWVPKRLSELHKHNRWSWVMFLDFYGIECDAFSHKIVIGTNKFVG